MFILLQALLRGQKRGKKKLKNRQNGKEPTCIFPQKNIWSSKEQNN